MSKKKEDGLPDRSQEQSFTNMKLPARKPDTEKDMAKLRSLFEDAEKKKKHNR